MSFVDGDLWERSFETAHGVVDEPWGFAVEDVDVPIHAWHGDADQGAPLALVQLVVERAPNGTLTVYPGEGHYLDAVHHPEMLKFLTGGS